ncbi:MAG TPA: EAL domain-containing protein [Gaiellaceae bacterium]|nr:EAL domain-containing protein [Gaiellaceae bacterium]
MRAWLVALVVGLVASAAAALRAPAGIPLDLASLAIGAGCVGAVALGVRRNRPSDRRGWRLVGASVGLLALGPSLVALARWLPELDMGFPSPADLALLTAAPLLGVGMLLALGPLDLRRDRAVVIDALAVTAAVALAAWVLVAEPSIDFVTASPQRGVGIAYLFGGLAVLCVASCATLLAWTPDIAGACLAVAGMLELALVPRSALAGEAAQAQGGGARFAALVALVLVAAGALHPSMTGPEESARRVELAIPRRRLTVLVGAGFVPAAMLALEAVRSGRLTLLATVAASVVLLLLLVTRLGDLLAGRERAVARERILGAGAGRLAAARSREEIERVATETVVGLAGEGACVVLGNRTVPFTAADGRRFMIVVEERRVGEIAIPAGRYLSADALRSVQTLASQVALAVDGVSRIEERAAGESEARFRSLVQNSSDLIALLAPDRTFTYLAPSVRSVLGFEPDELIGKALHELLHDEERASVEATVAAELRSPRTCTIEFRARRKDGSWCRLEAVVSNLVDDPSVAGLLLTGHDVTQRRELEEQLAHQAFHDPLTALANRALFLDRVANAIDRSKRTFLRVAVLFVDLDDFKTVNDSLGHAAGDELLVDVAGRLREAVRDADAVARLGGDEFAILLEGVDATTAEAIAARVLDTLAEPVVIEGSEIFPRASIGIALGGATSQATSLLREADAAMYDAKSAGKGRFSVFRPALHEAANQALALKADLIRAIGGDELQVLYQPIVRLVDGSISGFEALTRWPHAERGTVSPAEFIPLAEETGVIVDLGRLVLRRACAALARLRREVPGAERLYVTVNVSSRQLHGTSIVEDVRSALRNARLEPAALTLELTESALVHDVEDSVGRLQELKDLGVRIAIDDFGTGFSSLAYLQRFPVDVLKIAREFVHEVGVGAGEARVASAVVRLGSTLSLDIVAEGIETPAQRDELLVLGCDFGQGYLFARPLTFEDLAAAVGGSAHPVAATG